MSSDVASTDDGPGTAEQIAKPALMLASLGALGLALTLVWQLAIAGTFGTSAELDAFWIGAALPKGIADSFHLGILTLLFVVVFNLPRGDDADWERDRLASSVFNAMMLGTAVVGCALFLAAPTLTRWMGPGLEPALQAHSARTLRLLVFLLIPTGLVGAIAGILHAHQRFAPFALSRVVGLALQIVLLLLLAERFGTEALVFALILGASVMVVGCAHALKSSGFRYQLTLDFRGDEARSVLTMLIALVLLGVLARGNQLADRYFASLLGEGAVSALEFGWRFEIPVSQILAFSIALPSFALMALQAGSDGRQAFRETVATSVRLTALLVTPVVVFLVMLRDPLAALWFERGAFSPEAAALVASLIPYLGVMFAVLAFGPVLIFGMLTLHRKGILVAILCIEVAANAALNGPLSEAMGVRGIALATTLAMLASNAVLWVIFCRHIGGVRAGPVFARIARTLAVATAAGLAARVGGALIFGSFDIEGPVAILAAMLPLGICYLAVYAALCHLAGLIVIRFENGRPRVSLDLSETQAGSVDS